MRIRLFVSAVALVLCETPAFAEPIGRWFSGFGQGTVEYGLKNDSAGRDYFYMACPQDGATISFTVGGKNPRPFSTVIVVIGAEEYEMATDKWGEFKTDSHVSYDIYRSLWASIRSGSAMRVRLSTGQSTLFNLKGASKVLPREQCTTGFEVS